MSLAKKILFLFLCFVALNVYTISTFDYNKVKSDESSTNSFDAKHISQYFMSLKQKALDLKENLLSKNEEKQQEVVKEELKKDIEPILEKQEEKNKEIIVQKEENKENIEQKTQVITQTKISENDQKSQNSIKTEEKLVKNEENQEIIEKKQEIIPISNPIQTPKEIQSSIDEILAQNKITFKRRSTKITKDSYIAVKEISKILKKHKDLKIEIAGHTDSRGKASLNKRISQKRANSVRQELIKLGINKKRLKAVGYGEQFPIAKDDKNGLSEINRRVEINIIGVKK